MLSQSKCDRRAYEGNHIVPKWNSAVHFSCFVTAPAAAAGVFSAYAVSPTHPQTARMCGDDSLNRLATAGSATTWGDSYVYDPWGNLYQMNVTRGTGQNLQQLMDVFITISSAG